MDLGQGIKVSCIPSSATIAKCMTLKVDLTQISLHDFDLKVTLWRLGQYWIEGDAPHNVLVHILHKNHAGFFWARFFSVTETDVTIKIYKEYSKMD